MAWSFNNEQPLYLQIVDGIKRRIIMGEYAPGSQLPTVRQLAEETAINPNTVQKAMGQLEQEELVFSQGTIGRYISQDPELPKTLLTALASKQIRTFLDAMNTLGISREQTIQLIEDISKEDQE